MDDEVGRRAIATLRRAGIEIDDGLTEEELDEVERTYGIAFAPEHRAMLAAGLPVGPERYAGTDYPSWPQWRAGPEETLRRRLAAPVEWLLPDDDEPLTWWLRSWGRPPVDRDEAVSVARNEMSRWPTLIPIYSHRFMPAAPAPDPAPVLSVVGGDIIYYGADLLDYLQQEFYRPVDDSGDPPDVVFSQAPLPVEPWSNLDEVIVALDDA